MDTSTTAALGIQPDTTTTAPTASAAEALFGECSVEVVFSGNRNSSSPKNKRRGGTLSAHRSISLPITSPIRTTKGNSDCQDDPASPSPKKAGSRDASAPLLMGDDDDLPRLGSSRRSGSNTSNQGGRASSLLGSKRPRTSSPDSGARNSRSSSAFSIGREDSNDIIDVDDEVDEFDASYNITSDDECPTPPYHPVESRISLMTEKDLDKLSRCVEALTGRGGVGGHRSSSSQLSN